MTLYKSLQALEGVESHLFDCHRENVSKYFYDNFLQSSPVRHEKEYEEELTDYCSRHSIKLVVPATQFDLLFLSRRKEEFLNKLSCHVAVPDEEYLEVFLNKSSSQAFLKKAGFPVQKERSPLNKEHYPLIGKPIHGWGGRGVVVLKAMEELPHFKDRLDVYLWTDYIRDFREYSIDFAVDRQGRISPPVVRERLVVSGGFALISQKAMIPDHYMSLITHVFSHPTLSGIYNLQYISTSQGDFFTDLNPRVGTSAVWGNGTASNPVGHLLGLSAKSKLPDPTHKVVRYLDEKYISSKSDPVDEPSPKVPRDSDLLETAKEEGRKEREMEIVRAMKKEGLTVSEISHFTGLSEISLQGL